MNREKDSITSLLTLTYTREDINEYAADTDVYGTFMLIEVDNLKQLNDMYGYSFGDQMIAAIAKNFSAPRPGPCATAVTFSSCTSRNVWRS